MLMSVVALFSLRNRTSIWQRGRKLPIWMPLICGEFVLYKQQSSDIWQCLNCALRATGNNYFTPFTCFWTADGGATVLCSGCYFFFFSLPVFLFSKTFLHSQFDLVLTKCVLWALFITWLREKRPLKKQRRKKKTALPALTIVCRVDCNCSPLGSRASFCKTALGRPTAPEHSTWTPQ